jgi:type II restriction enzyme
MLTTMESALAAAYRSGCQSARVVTEAWAEQNLYCAACPSDELRTLPRNEKAYDFQCPRCSTYFQLKSSRTRFGSRIPDGAYGAFTTAIRENRTPNLVALRYTPKWTVLDVFVVPNFALTLSCVQLRPALPTTARRAGWVGCNILLSNIPIDARIGMINNATIIPRREVRGRYRRLRELASLPHEQRGWAFDVLTTVRNLGCRRFTLNDIYADAGRLSRLHPNNQYVEAKVRQQLQRLRDAGILKFCGRGQYEMVIQREH